MRVSINPKRELFVWGPIEGAWHYPSYWALCYVDRFPLTYGVRWPEALFSFDHHKMTYICEYDALRKAGWRVMEKWVLPEAKYRLVRSRFDRTVGKLQAINREVEYRLSSRGRAARGRGDLTGLPRRSDRSVGAPRNDIVGLYHQWKEVYLDFWLHGLVPEIANWGQEKYVMDMLKRRGLSGQEYLQALEVLSAPSELGFFQEEERDLLRIATLTPTLSHQGRGRIEKHTKKYFWLHNSYFETRILGTNDFARMLKEEIKKGRILERRAEIEQSPQKRKQEKERMIKKLGLTLVEANVARKLGQTISWQDERKKYVWQANHVIDLWLREVARRAQVSFTLCKDLLPDEVELILKGGKVDVRGLARERLISVIHFTKQWKWQVVTGVKARRLLVPYEKHAHASAHEVHGLVVSKGPKVRGIVRLIFSPHKEQKRMKQGDILVTGMTSPDYIVVMKRAAAIVTDTGGITSHAAVISRELGVPCIVGTKVATQIFKDGDMVEVDTEKGLVRKV